MVTLVLRLCMRSIDFSIWVGVILDLRVGGGKNDCFLFLDLVFGKVFYGLFELDSICGC